MGLIFKTLAFVLFLVALSATSFADVREPKKIKSAKKLRAAEGALQLSVRAQVQTTQTLFVYFIKVNEDGSDGSDILQFERGAGVPIFGSNMIDPKPVTYRVPAGKYRPLAFSMACQGVPGPASYCSGLGGSWPTGFYAKASPSLEVKAGHLTQAGDFILEYSGIVPEGKHVGEVKKRHNEYDLRWKPLKVTAITGFEKLPILSIENADTTFQSRIKCEARPEGVTLYIPFEC